MKAPSMTSGSDHKERILLVLMPWALPLFPGLGAALLRTILNREGLGCDICYGNLVFSKAIEGDPFFEFNLGKLAISELAFTPHYFDTSNLEAAERLQSYLSPIAPRRIDQEVNRYLWLVERSGQAVEEVFAAIPWQEYDIVGFSIMMQQTVASLALAKKIKTSYPNIRILFGGPNCSWPMGAEIIRSFPEVDFVVEGEADAAIVPLVRQIRACAAGPFTVPGLYFRDENQMIGYTGPAQPFRDVDSLPVPDYTPFFEQLEALGLDHVQPYLQMETSRGCWWGEKHHCSFCSLEDALITFRAKSEVTILNEILTLASRHRYTEFFPTDSILYHRFYNTLLPEIGRIRQQYDYDFTFYFEVKSNLDRDNAQILRYAGVNSVQPGIESFSDHVLQLMDKGTTGVRQLHCLKSLAECGIEANWNLIYRNPNETTTDYRDLIEMLPFMHHLPPLHAEGLTQMLLMRFSPYFENPDRYGINNVRPADFFIDIFPDPCIDLDKLVFYFDYDHPDHDNEELKELYKLLAKAIDIWRLCYRKDSLVQVRGPGFVQVFDRRVQLHETGQIQESRQDIITLTDPWAEVFSYCDEPRTEKGVVRAFSNRVAEKELHAFIEEMITLRLMYRSPGGQLITLPLLKDPQKVCQSPK